MLRTLNTQTINSLRIKNAYPLIQREVLNVIDQCSQILSEEKILLRNRIKYVFKGSQTSEDDQQLLQIFANCEKALTKVHLFQNHWHWLQVKIRKWVANIRRKQKQESITNFKKQQLQKDHYYYQSNEFKQKYQKYVNLYGKSQTKRSKDSGSKHLFSNDENRIKSSTNNTMRVKSPTSLFRNLSPSYKSPSRFNQFRKIKQTNFDQTIGYAKWSKIKQKSKQSQQKYTQFQPFQTLRKSHHKIHNQSEPRKIQKKQIKSSKREKFSKSNQKNISSGEKMRLGSFLDHQLSSEGLKDYSIHESFNNKPKTYSSAFCQYNDQNIKTQKNQDIFTAPQLLQQCRRFIQKADKNQESLNTGSLNTGTFNISSKFQKEIKNVHNHSTRQQNICLDEQFNDTVELVRWIFRKDWIVYISPYELQNWMEKCPNQKDKNALERIFNHSKDDKNFYNFLKIYPLLKSHLNFNFVFSNIFVVLDIDQKQYVDDLDYQIFLDNFKDTPLESQILLDLTAKIKAFESRVSDMFKDQQIIPGCFEYLQLIKNPQIYELGNMLQMFQFQIGDNPAQ